MDGSIEEATIQIQQEKRKLMRLAFAEKKGKRDQAKTGRLDDIRRLLRTGNDANKSGGESARGYKSGKMGFGTKAEEL